MIEENLIQYGVLGLWTITLLYDRYCTQKKLMEAFNGLRDAILRKKIRPY